VNDIMIIVSLLLAMLAGMLIMLIAVMGRINHDPDDEMLDMHNGDKIDFDRLFRKWGE
jgi:hypothetical protein